MGCFGSKGSDTLNRDLEQTQESVRFDGVTRGVRNTGMIDIATIKYLADVLMAVDNALSQWVTRVSSIYQSPNGDVRTIQTISSGGTQESYEETVRANCQTVDEEILWSKKTDLLLTNGVKTLKEEPPQMVHRVVKTDVSDLISSSGKTGKYMICSVIKPDVRKDLTHKVIRMIAKKVLEHATAAVKNNSILSLLSQHTGKGNAMLKIVWRTSGWENIIGSSTDFWAMLNTLDRPASGPNTNTDRNTEELVKMMLQDGGVSLAMVRTIDGKGKSTLLVHMLSLMQEADLHLIACQVHALLNDAEDVEIGEEDADGNLDGSASNTERGDSLFDSIRTGTLIGKGGYGSVYRAILNGKIVALKVLEGVEPPIPLSTNSRNMHLSTSNKIVGEKEIEVGRRLLHKNIIRTMDYATRTIEGREQTWIVLEFCESGSLRQLIEDRYFDSFGKILRVAKEIATGMAYLHSQQLLHGDLSSNNVLFDKDYAAKISDFGLSRDFAGVTVITSALGTTCYMAPELLSSGKLNKAGDVYSYGILLLEMLTGKRAFSGMRYVEVITSKLADESNLLLESIPSDAPEVIKEVICECTRMEYNTRPSFDQVLTRFVGI